MSPVTWLRKVSHWYDRRLLAQLIDILRITGYTAVHRDLLSRQRRQVLPERMIRIGRQTYYLLAQRELPRRVRQIRSDWPVVDKDREKKAEE